MFGHRLTRTTLGVFFGDLAACLIGMGGRGSLPNPLNPHFPDNIGRGVLLAS